jgi:hypothetical protein
VNVQLDKEDNRLSSSFNRSRDGALNRAKWFANDSSQLS